MVMIQFDNTQYGKPFEEILESAVLNEDLVLRMIKDDNLSPDDIKKLADKYLDVCFADEECKLDNNNDNDDDKVVGNEKRPAIRVYIKCARTLIQSGDTQAATIGMSYLKKILPDALSNKATEDLVAEINLLLSGK